MIPKLTRRSDTDISELNFVEDRDTDIGELHYEEEEEDIEWGLLPEFDTHG